MRNSQVPGQKEQVPLAWGHREGKSKVTQRKQAERRMARWVGRDVGAVGLVESWLLSFDWGLMYKLPLFLAVNQLLSGQKWCCCKSLEYAGTFTE